MAYTASRHPHSFPVRATRCAYAHAGSASIDNPSSSLRGRGPHMAERPAASSDVIGVASHGSLHGASPVSVGDAPSSVSAFSGRRVWLAPCYLTCRYVAGRGKRATHSLFPVEDAPAQAPSTTEPLPFGVSSDAPPKRTGGGSVVEWSTRNDDRKEGAIRSAQ